MKLKLSIFLLMFITLFTSCDNFFKPDATSVAITSSVSKVPTLSSITLAAAVLPLEASQSVTWTSSDETIATVSTSGVVSGLKPGKVTITAKSGLKSTTKTIYVGYENDFTNAGGWDESSSGGQTTSFANGELNISINNAGSSLFKDYARYTNLVNNEYVVKIAAPYEISVDVVVNSASQTANAIISSGILFNYLYTDSTHYSYSIAVITSNGKFLVDTLTATPAGTNWTTETYASNSNIYTDNRKNNLKITQTTTGVIFSINGVNVKEYTKATTTDLYRIGVATANSSNETTYTINSIIDNFKAYPID